jgi:hypothetical protein
MDCHAEQQAEYAYRDMAFASLDEFARVKTARPFLRRFHGLAVDDGGGGRGLPALPDTYGIA